MWLSYIKRDLLSLRLVEVVGARNYVTNSFSQWEIFFYTQVPGHPIYHPKPRACQSGRSKELCEEGIQHDSKSETLDH